MPETIKIKTAAKTILNFVASFLFMQQSRLNL